MVLAGREDAQSGRNEIGLAEITSPRGLLHGSENFVGHIDNGAQCVFGHSPFGASVSTPAGSSGRSWLRRRPDWCHLIDGAKRSREREPGHAL